MTIKVLLDTDIDIVGDIDDAMCLAYLLAQPMCKLLGITTVSWDTVHRARVASALCKSFGYTVPIFPGAETPLLVPLPAISTDGSANTEEAILEKWDHDHLFPRGEAIEFMRQTIRAHPGQVVLLAIGPLTNVALLFAADPEIPALLKGLVTMAGIFTHRIPGAPLREWNALVDPHATAIVYRSALTWHRSIGLDVTLQVQMTADQVRQHLHNTHLTLLQEMTEAWFQQAETVTFHDPLAAATIFDGNICKYERGIVEVELTSEKLQGLTYWTADSTSHRHEVATEVQPARFFDHYFKTLGHIDQT